MSKFEIKRLVDYTDKALLDEIRRVAALVPDQKLTKSLFNSRSHVHHSTITKRFNGWRSALIKAGLGDSYSMQPVSEKMHKQDARNMTDEELLSELKRVAEHLQKKTFTYSEFNKNSRFSYKVYLTRFGGWEKALKKVDLTANPVGRRYSDKECYENLLNAWTHYGRQPTYDEMDRPPSKVGKKAYMRWGTWNKALTSFVSWANKDASEPVIQEPVKNTPKTKKTTKLSEQDRRDVPLRLRYQILVRDHHKCVICGRSPATTPITTLEVDHIVSVRDGGKTTFDNLRTTCKECNSGKGAKSEGL